MRWLKHLTNARNSEDLVIVRNEFGMAGIGRWWTLCEVVGEKSKNDCFELTLTVAQWCSELSTNRQQLIRFLAALEELRLCSWVADRSLIRVAMPKLAKFRDEYARKSGHTPDKVAPESEPESDTETESSSNRPSLRASRTRGPKQAVHLAGEGNQKPKPKTQADVVLERVMANVGATTAKIRDMLTDDPALDLAVRAMGGWTKVVEDLASGGVGAQNRMRIAFGQACEELRGSRSGLDVAKQESQHGAE